MNTRRIPFMSLVPGEDATAVRRAIDRVIERGWFVLGPEVEAFEHEFAASVRFGSRDRRPGTGTDALALILRALGIGAGDEVITTPLSAAYSALAVMMAGARPVFADIDQARLTLDPRTDRARRRSADARDPAGTSLRTAGGHGGHRAHRRAAQPGDRGGLLSGAPGDGRRPARSAPSASRARSASTRPRISVRSATAARSSPAIPRWPSG